MALSPIEGTVPAAGPPKAQGHRAALTLLASLFFMWGFITVINGTLLPHLRSRPTRCAIRSGCWPTAPR